MTAIDCPVCQRPQVVTPTCPNCEADLIALQLLAQLPPVPAAQSAWYLWLALALNSVLVGLLVKIWLGAD
jgi:hypothetical protein